MNTETWPEGWEVIRVGLAQIPTGGLKRLIKHIDAAKPLLLFGDVVISGVG